MFGNKYKEKDILGEGNFAKVFKVESNDNMKKY